MATSENEIGGTEFDQLCEMMGREWVCNGLVQLKREIDELFANPSIAADRQEVAQRAHLLIAHAGLFGFSILSRLCGELEVACMGQGEIFTVFGRTRAAANLADNRAGELIKFITQTRSAPSRFGD